MTRLYLDIETVPAPNAEQITHRKTDETDVDYLTRLSCSGTTGMIVCIGYAIDDDPPETFAMDKMWLSSDNDGWRESESWLLTMFWGVVRQCAASGILFIGHNVLDFDLRHLVQRSIIHRVKTGYVVPFTRFRNSPVYDTMQEWCKWRGGVKLAELALAFGLPSPKTVMEGSSVRQHYLDRRFDDIATYCKGDVETTRSVYKRMQGA